MHAFLFIRVLICVWWVVAGGYVQLPVEDDRVWASTSATYAARLKGAAAAELVGIQQCCFELDDQKHTWNSAVMYVSSVNVANYLNGQNPVSVDGHCLFPLVYFVRRSIARLKAARKEVHVEAIPSEYNLAGNVARNLMRMRRNENWNVGGDDVGMILRSEGLVECIKLVASYQYRADQNNQPGLSRECIETAPPAVMDIGRWDAGLLASPREQVVFRPGPDPLGSFWV